MFIVSFLKLHFPFVHLFAQLYDIMYSDLTKIIYTQLYDFKLFLFNNDLFAHSNMFSNISM